jgi:serine/threonine protein kinase
MHPLVDALAAEPVAAEVEAHLRTCPACRIQRRLHLAAAAPEDAVPGLSEARLSLSASREASIASFGFELDQGRHALPRGARIGPWRIEARIGAGAAAVVYRVRHADRGDVAALKVVDAPSEAMRRRVGREAAAQGQLEHPNVVGVLDVLEVDGRPGLLLELVPGPTLAEVLAADVVPLEVRLGLGLDLLDGIAAAHAAGLVHRDLKPTNILVDPRDGNLVARIADFGLVKLGLADASRLTRTGAVLGTPAYMAPEQIRDSAGIDARADVFALGAVLFELITGERAFRGASMLEIFDRIRSGTRPSLREIAPHLPEPLVLAVDGALRTDRGERLPTVEAVRALWVEGGARACRPAPDAVEAVARLVQDRPVHHRGPTWPLQGPGSASALIGRDGLLMQLVEGLHRPGWTVLVGQPGVGTTALALEASAQAAPYLPGGAVHVRLAEAETPDEVVDAILAALGLPLARPEDLPASLAAHGPLLLVLDHVRREALGALASVGAAAPELRVLATAHRPLDVPGERVLEVPPLLAGASRALWGELAGGDVAEDGAEALIEACGGLPLAIRLAACGAEPTASEPPDDPLRSCARAARRVLPPEAVRAWELATVFRGGFTTGALAAVLGDGESELVAEDLLDELVEIGVVRSAGAAGAPRFWLVDAVRPEVGAPPEAFREGAPPEALDRLVAWYSGPGGALPEGAQADRGNLRVAVARACATGDRVGAEQCGRRLLAAIWEAGTEVEARALAERLGLPLPREAGPRRRRLATLTAQAVEALEAGEVRAARAHAAAAVREAGLRALPESEARARALLDLIDGRSA